MSGTGGHKPPAYVTFTQQLDPQYWSGWDPGLVMSKDAGAIMAECVRRYEAAGGEAAGAWAIVHDKDMLPDGSLKADHIHGIIQQAAARSTTGRLQCLEIDAALGFTGSVSRAPSRGGRIENAQGYLIHAKDPNKHQYAVTEVCTVRGQPYSEIEEAHRRAWRRRAVMNRSAPVTAKEWAELGDALIQRVLEGDVDELDILQNETLGDVYTRNKAKVDLAFGFRARRDMRSEVEKLRSGVFQKTVIWVMGASDQGKSYLAEGIARELESRLGWTTYRAAARNGLDDYPGAQILVLNEPGSRVMDWPDLLSLFDPRHAGPISARYANKAEAAPRVIIVAVSIDPVEFGFFVPGKRSTGDSLDQLVRRVTLLIGAQKVDGEPRYSVGRVSNVDPYTRIISVPGERITERIALSYACVAPATQLSRDEALETALFHIAERSPDAALAIEASASVESRRRAQLVARGIVLDRSAETHDLGDRTIELSSVAAPWEDDTLGVRWDDVSHGGAS